MCRHKMAGFVPGNANLGTESRFLCPLACDNCWFGGVFAAIDWVELNSQF